jgi:hypothetical protein
VIPKISECITPEMATVQQQTTQLEFHQAMADFKTMFPDMDDEVIEVKAPTSPFYTFLRDCKILGA